MRRSDSTEPITYPFGGSTWKAQTFDPESEHGKALERLFEASDRLGEEGANNVLLIQGYDADGGICAHADDEGCMKRNEKGEVCPIVSFSYGAPARFRLTPIAPPPAGQRRKSEYVMLNGGDALVMLGGAQERYNHGIPKGGIMPLSEQPRPWMQGASRVSLTFRQQL